MPKAERVALFRQGFDALFPHFYEPADGQADAAIRALVSPAGRSTYFALTSGSGMVRCRPNQEG